MSAILLRPLAYLTVRHPDKLPSLVNWVVPAIVAGITVMLVGVFAKTSIDVWGAAGVVNRLLGFTQNLPGFYIAALAAVATFGGVGMKNLMPGIPPTMNIRHNGVLVRVDLTRGLFLTSMFAYLTALSLLLTLTAVAGLALAESVKSMVPVNSYPFLKTIATFVYLMFIAQLACITFWGLYYLGERMYLSDS
jgi:hypothetical protein